MPDAIQANCGTVVALYGALGVLGGQSRSCRPWRSRGTAVVIAIVCLSLVSMVVALLARSGAARVQARRADVEREVSLRRAESALDVARLAVEGGRLKPGGSMEAEGLKVACAAVAGGVELTANAEAPLPPGVTASSLRRMLKVKWTLTVEGAVSRLSDWQTDYETVSTRPALKVGRAGAGKKKTP